ncbi:Transmembrane channel-like protein 3 [Sarcoptes scabiei]|uniref:Transmembrane channel-like protein 3 n=1 Tax=Sarcoptes scabiei TaxID=52283 RepID=A0A834VE38_SARSC|nr:Transmembrane channel-like protein 3 [Sarcoptes scabiei]
MYTLMLSLFGKVDSMTTELLQIKANISMQRAQLDSVTISTVTMMAHYHRIKRDGRDGSEFYSVELLSRNSEFIFFLLASFKRLEYEDYESNPNQDSDDRFDSNSFHKNFNDINGDVGGGTDLSHRNGLEIFDPPSIIYDPYEKANNNQEFSIEGRFHFKDDADRNRKTTLSEEYRLGSYDDWSVTTDDHHPHPDTDEERFTMKPGLEYTRIGMEQMNQTLNELILTTETTLANTKINEDQSTNKQQQLRISSPSIRIGSVLKGETSGPNFSLNQTKSTPTTSSSTTKKMSTTINQERISVGSSQRKSTSRMKLAKISTTTEMVTRKTFTVGQTSTSRQPTMSRKISGDNIIVGGGGSCENVTEYIITDDDLISLNETEKDRLRKLCWETMFGQELVKLTVMDFILTVLSTLISDFIRALIVRYCNGCTCFCWNLEKGFPGYGDFKIAENILHLVNNQGMIWLGMFFSPGLPAINSVKLCFLMYVRSWAVLTCNIPHETVFKASRNNNFYFMLLLIMLFLCTLPVSYAVVWLEPSWHCGPFSGYTRIYKILSTYVESKLPGTLNKVLDYLTSPGAVLPTILLLILFIYYLLSTVSVLKDANKELKSQIRKDKDDTENSWPVPPPEIVTESAPKHVRIQEDQKASNSGGNTNESFNVADQSDHHLLKATDNITRR